MHDDDEVLADGSAAADEENQAEESVSSGAGDQGLEPDANRLSSADDMDDTEPTNDEDDPDFDDEDEDNLDGQDDEFDEEDEDE